MMTAPPIEQTVSEPRIGYTADDLEAKTGTPAHTIRKLIREKRIHAQRLGWTWVVSPEEAKRLFPNVSF